MKTPCSAFFLLLFLALRVFPISFEKPIGNHSFYAEFNDPYYISSGIYLSLTGSNMPSLNARRESDIYRYLAQHAFEPTSLLFELGGYPMQAAGAAVRYRAPDYYQRLSWNNINAVKTITASMNFPEPWSVSAFLGHVVQIQGDSAKPAGKGNIGLLCSYGNLHIKDNLLYHDNWGEFEAKLKVDKSGQKTNYSMSYRIGARVHGNPDIRSLTYLGLRRERTDMEDKGFSLVRNTNFDIRTDYAFSPLQFTRLDVEAGKKVPISIGKYRMAIGLSLGFIWDAGTIYRNGLKGDFKPGQVSPIANPLVRF